MILLREIQDKDLGFLERCAKIPGLFNLPDDRDQLQERVDKSKRSFNLDTQAAEKIRSDTKYIFAAEDLATGRTLGTSMIAGQHGTVDSPHFYFEVGNEEKFSETINTGFIHGTLKLKYDTNGPSEIGGLVLDPEHRNSEQRIGRQISFVRFLFLGMHRARFRKKIIAELLPPLDQKGHSPLWEAVGRRFTNMEYWEADELCQRNKEFIFSLFPSGKIYTTFLPADAKHSIGKVGRETEPVLHMLKKIGFEYKQQVDPFDGGPHLWAEVADLLPVKKIIQCRYDPSLRAEGSEGGLVAKTESKPGTFRAAAVQALVDRSPGEIARINWTGPSAADVASALDLKPGDPMQFMPYY